MRRCLILTQNPALAASLRQWLPAKGLAEDEQIAIRTVGKAPEPTDVSREFQHQTDWLEEELAKGVNHQGLPEVIVLTDLAGYGTIEPAHLNPIMHHGWATVLGMLVLAFPEVHWVLVAGDLNESLMLHGGADPKRLEQVMGLSSLGFHPLFDAGGLRHEIRESLTANSIKSIKVPLRKELAAAVDEEHSFTFLHAYTAYRFGFRAHVITTDGAMKQFLRADSSQPSQRQAGLLGDPPKPLLVFEDVFLHFADTHEENFSNLRKRDESFPFLAEARFRVLVTSGHHHGQDDEARQENPIYRRALRDNGQWNCELQKPLAGMFRLWKDAGLDQRLREGGRHSLAPGFEWPLIQNSSSGSGHSAPGRLLVVADRLIARAERMGAEVRSVPQAVYGAVLATDALELLGGKTPTTSLEALMLRHQFESLAECQFVGTQHHVDVEGRIEDLDREVEALSCWFGETDRARKIASWNIELAMLNKLIQVFRDYNQFDEEQALQVRARRLHRKLWLHQRPWLKPFEFVPWYVERLLASVPLFLMAIVGWIFVLGLLFHWVGGAKVPIDHGIADAFGSFLGVQPPSDNELWDSRNGWNGAFCVIASTIALGFLHLGIFISHLYSMITRK